MFERATANLIATATAAAAAAMAVFALGFALYALALPYVGPAWAAAIVAGASALIVALCSLFAHHRAMEKERQAELEQARMMSALPINIGELAREHPLTSIAVTMVAGALAARHPRLSRDLISIIARFAER